MLRGKDELLTEHAFVVLKSGDYEYGFIVGYTVQYIDKDKSDKVGIYISGWDHLDSVVSDIKTVIQNKHYSDKLGAIDYGMFIDQIEKDCGSIKNIVASGRYDYWEAEPEYKELTVAQIEEKLGCKIKIVRG